MEEGLEASVSANVLRALPLIRAARGNRARAAHHQADRPLGGANALRTAEEVASEKEKEKKPETFVAETAESLLIRKPPFPALRVLDVSANAVANAATLRLGVLRTTLTTLDLSENDLTRLDGLETLAALETLSLDRNRVKHLEPDAFAGLGNLRVLRMEENGRVRSRTSTRSFPCARCTSAGTASARCPSWRSWRRSRSWAS